MRHLIILAMGWFIANGSNVVGNLHLTPIESTGAGVIVTWLILIFTPLTNQYGVGKTPAA